VRPWETSLLTETEFEQLCTAIDELNRQAKA
jgi:hypothetical protein